MNDYKPSPTDQLSTYGDIAVYRAKRRAKYVAKSIAAVVAPILTEGAFMLADELNTVDAPPTIRFILTTLITGLAVYRTKNGPKV
jgi:hypothetical protein